MKQQEQVYTVIPTFVPLTSITRITAMHTFGRLPIATVDAPERICGMARRIGYTGREPSDLAIYRLKVKLGAENYITMLPTMFVVDEGRFIDYQEWQQTHSVGA